jgi:fructose-1-phosphate kinase PfkB-like protein
VNINSTKERIQDQGYKVSMLKIQGTRKQLRHMLHDDDAGSIGGQRPQHLLQRFRAAGRSADGHHLFRRLGHRVRRG